jgi:hypothetical protein
VVDRALRIGVGRLTLEQEIIRLLIFSMKLLSRFIKPFIKAIELRNHHLV